MQWNNHGYDIAKMFAAKFSHVCPVWLQLTRRYIGVSILILLSLMFFVADMERD